MIVNLAIHKLYGNQQGSTQVDGDTTHNIAYMILATRTSLLPISRWCISSGVKPRLVVLFVPQSRTTCTSPILANNGIMLKAMILSSLKSLSVRTNLPASRTNIIAKAKEVHHQETSSVGLSWILLLGGGGLVYSWRERGRNIIIERDAHQPPKRGERSLICYSCAMKALDLVP